MTYTILILVMWLLVAWLFTQTLWMLLRHWFKFLKYLRMWKAAECRFNEAASLFNAAAQRSDEPETRRNHALCHQIVQEQLHYMRAQRAVMRDNFIPPWRWIERWNADYLKETEKAA